MLQLLRAGVIALIVAALGAAILITGGPVLVRAAEGSNCETWRAREVEPLSVSTETLIDTVVETPTYDLPVPGRWTGMSLPGATLHQGGSSGLVLVHEAAHQVQMKRDGLVQYSWRYAHEWLSGVFAGCSFYASYRAVSYEQQARRSVDDLPGAVRALMHEVGGPEDLSGLRADVQRKQPRSDNAIADDAGRPWPGGWR